MSMRGQRRGRRRKRAGVVVTSAGVIDVRIIERLDELRELAPRLREVHRRSRRRSSFTTPEFIERYCRQNKKVRPYVACGFRDCELVAYLPLKRVREGVGPLRRSKLDLLCVHGTGLPHVVARADVDAGVGTALVEYLLQHEGLGVPAGLLATLLGHPPITTMNG